MLSCMVVEMCFVSLLSHFTTRYYSNGRASALTYWLLSRAHRRASAFGDAPSANDSTGALPSRASHFYRGAAHGWLASQL